MNTRTSTLYLPLTVVFFCSALNIQAAAPVTENWDDAVAGANGWTGNTTSSVVIHSTTDGNPDGHIVARRSGTFDIGALIDAPPATDFHGDYAAAGIGYASVDLRFQQGTFTDAWIRFRSASTVNGWRYPLTNVFPDNVWNTYDVAFDPTWSDTDAMNAGWIKGDAPVPSFAATMADVDTAEVRVAGSSTSLIVGIDNFVLAVPEPATFMLFVMATATLFLQRRR